MDPMDDMALGSSAQPIPAGFDAETAENNEAIEQQFAVVCMEQAETYWNLITKLKPSTLARLTPFDDEIVASFTELFPEIVASDEQIKRIDEEAMKSADGKAKWRILLSRFEKSVVDYNFGTMIRMDCEDEYTEKNSIFGLRLQFFAFEILRNRRGFNDAIWTKHQHSA